MKPIKILMQAVAMLTMILAANQASAFPLTLRSVSGIISSTAVAGSNATATRSAIVLKKMMLVVSNEVLIDGGPTPPANATIAIDPFQYDSVNVTFQVYLTNSTGYYYSLSSNNIAYCNIYDMATTFKTNSNAGSESDTINVELDLAGDGLDGYFYEFHVIGSGRLIMSTNFKTGLAVTTISLGNIGSGNGVYQSSDDGVSTGGFVLQGSGIPPITGPYSTWWYNNVLF